jgi:hypothetical protein
VMWHWVKESIRNRDPIYHHSMQESPAREDEEEEGVLPVTETSSPIA